MDELGVIGGDREMLLDHTVKRPTGDSFTFDEVVVNRQIRSPLELVSNSCAVGALAIGCSTEKTIGPPDVNDAATI